MSPALIVVEGPLKGAILSLLDAEVSLGRDESNTLAIDDPAASRRHCSIRRDGETFRLKDLGSRNGTLVNGRTARQWILEHGDQIRIGTSVFLFSRQTSPPGKPAVVLDALMLQTQSTTRLCSQGSRYLQPQQIESVPYSPDTTRDLAALLLISTALQQSRTVEGLAQRFLELLLAAIPATRAAMLLIGSASSGFSETFGLHRDGESIDSIRINPAVTGRVVTERTAILVDNPAGFPGDEPSCVIVAPLICGEEVHGVLYADTSDPILRFEDSHLQLATAAGVIAGMTLAHVLRLNALHAENQLLQREISLQHDMIGESPPMAQMYRQIDRAAPTDASVLIQGESGTGKELVARAIHRNSRRAAKPFVAINCAALTESLLESELFGHERGAFTGALSLRKGRFELADGGTLFLDEIAEMALAPQAKLLRVLQEQEFERVGGSRPIRVNTRVVAATNKDLKSQVGKGAFREDLYYRLKVISIRVPALRERRADIPLLARYFLTQYAARTGRRVTGFSLEAQEWLIQYEWPGNIRELQHSIEQAVILGATEEVRLPDLREVVMEHEESTLSPPPARYHDAIDQARRQVIRQAFEQAGGVYTEAARLLGIHPVHLHRMVRGLEMKPELKKKELPSLPSVPT